MYTSDKPAERGRRLSASGAYLAAAAACALFGGIYEIFSHGVYSCYMLCAFVFPLLLGSCPFYVMERTGRAFPCTAVEDFVHGGVAALTVGSIMQGVLEIYGTANPLTAGFWIAGAALTVAGWLMTLLWRQLPHGGS